MKFVLSSLLFVVVLSACSNEEKTAEKTTETTTEFQDEHTAKNSLDFIGEYGGVLPCADCAGIRTILVLNADETWVQKSLYADKSDEVFKTQGTFKWNDAGNEIILSEKTEVARFFVTEDAIIQLDKEGKRITGELEDQYRLTKGYNPFQVQIESIKTVEKIKKNTEKPAREEISLENNKWILVEILGKKVKSKKENYLTFSSSDGRFSAYGGCNQMGGAYVLNKENGIKFSKMISTQMACEDMTIESQFSEILPAADRYAISGNQLSLSKGKMGVVAKFELKK